MWKISKFWLSGNFEVVSIGTGTSCLGKSQLSNNGSILHDCHAEIIAKKSLQRYSF